MRQNLDEVRRLYETYRDEKTADKKLAKSEKKISKKVLPLRTDIDDLLKQLKKEQKELCNAQQKLIEHKAKLENGRQGRLRAVWALEKISLKRDIRMEEEKVAEYQEKMTKTQAARDLKEQEFHQRLSEFESSQERKKMIEEINLFKKMLTFRE